MLRLLASSTILLLILLTGPSIAQEAGPAAAPERSGPQPHVTAYNGSFTETVEIKVPEFRGLEPKLALTYDSARGLRNIPSAGGWLGVGWSISGMSAIERVSGATGNSRNARHWPRP